MQVLRFGITWPLINFNQRRNSSSKNPKVDGTYWRSTTAICGSPRRQRALLHWRAWGAVCPDPPAASSGGREKAVHETHFPRPSLLEHETLPLADHPLDLEAFDRAEAAGNVLNPRVGLISRFNAPRSATTRLWRYFTCRCSTSLAISPAHLSERTALP